MQTSIDRLVSDYLPVALVEEGCGIRGGRITAVEALFRGLK